MKLLEENTRQMLQEIGLGKAHWCLKAVNQAKTDKLKSFYTTK
jgi:hypothetical protein